LCSGLFTARGVKRRCSQAPVWFAALLLADQGEAEGSGGAAGGGGEADGGGEAGFVLRLVLERSPRSRLRGRVFRLALERTRVQLHAAVSRGGHCVRSPRVLTRCSEYLGVFMA